MSYQLYRNTTIGHTLQESLDEFVQVNSMNIFDIICLFICLYLFASFPFCKYKSLDK